MSSQELGLVVLSETDARGIAQVHHKREEDETILQLKQAFFIAFDTGIRQLPAKDAGDPIRQESVAKDTLYGMNLAKNDNDRIGPGSFDRVIERIVGYVEDMLPDSNGEAGKKHIEDIVRGYAASHLVLGNTPYAVGGFIMDLSRRLGIPHEAIIDRNLHFFTEMKRAIPKSDEYMGDTMGVGRKMIHPITGALESAGYRWDPTIGFVKGGPSAGGGSRGSALTSPRRR